MKIVFFPIKVTGRGLRWVGLRRLLLLGLGATLALLLTPMGNEESASDESFADGLLEYPQYTRPAEFRGWNVPEVLRSGDHGKIARWRRAQALARTIADRPDLIQQRGGLSEEDQRALEEFGFSRYRGESPPGERQQESSAPCSGERASPTCGRRRMESSGPR